MNNGKREYPILLWRDSWDKPVELCKPVSPEAAGAVVAALLASGDESIVRIEIHPRRPFV